MFPIDSLEFVPRLFPTSSLEFSPVLPYLPNDAACLKYLMNERYGGTNLTCKGCGEHREFKLVKGRRAYACTGCRYQINPTKGTPLHNTLLPLNVWLHALDYANDGRPMSVSSLQMMFGLSPKTARRLAQRVKLIIP